MSTALRAASSASSEPSVASRILVGKMLIATLSFPVDVPSTTCANCINTLVQLKGIGDGTRPFRKGYRGLFSGVRGETVWKLRIGSISSPREPTERAEKVPHR